MKKEILNDEFEQCPVCESYDSYKDSAMSGNAVRVCNKCKCRWWMKNVN